MRKNRFTRRVDIEFPNPAICYCSSDPPDPDPLIGQAAKDNAAISKEMAEVAKDQLAWNKERALKADPLTQKIAEQQIATSDINTARSADQWDTYQRLFRPVEEKMVSDANAWDSDERKERMAAEAGADVATGYQAASDANQRQMQSIGINPNSGRYATLNNETSLSRAKDTAGAMNKARRDTEQQGLALRTGVAQFGRNMPSTGIAADTTSLNAGTAAGNTMATAAGVNNAASNTAANWYGGATGANSSAGNLALGQYGQQLNAWNQDQQNKASSMAGIGQGLGMAAMFMRRGGIIGKPRALPRIGRPNYRSGLAALRRGGARGRGYADGGVIDEEDPGYGERQDGTRKGRGWIGAHKNARGEDMTEYTVGVPVHGREMDVPTFVPGLTPEEIAHLRTEPDMSTEHPLTRSILGKASDHAHRQISAGKSVFAPQKYATGGLLQRNYAEGGVVGEEGAYGYEMREPHDSEHEYFKANPNVSGMATEDGRIILNPHSGLTPEQQQSVVKNEASRLYMREHDAKFDFDVTPEQHARFQEMGGEYAKPENIDHLKSTIVSRIIAGDPSAGNVTPQQRKAAQGIQSELEKRGRKQGYRAGGLLQRNYAAGGVVDPNAPPPGGGMVAGPGTGTSDSVPALVDGKQPIQVSNGEAVLNVGAVQLLGEDFVHRVNAAGLDERHQPMEEPS